MTKTKGRATEEHSEEHSEEHNSVGGTGSERSYLAAAHNKSNSEEARRHAAQEYVKLHQERTGEKLNVNEIMHQEPRTHHTKH